MPVVVTQKPLICKLFKQLKSIEIRNIGTYSQVIKKDNIFSQTQHPLTGYPNRKFTLISYPSEFRKYFNIRTLRRVVWVYSRYMRIQYKRYHIKLKTLIPFRINKSKFTAANSEIYLLYRIKIFIYTTILQPLIRCWASYLSTVLFYYRQSK